MFAQYKPHFNLSEFIIKLAAFVILFVLSLCAYMIVQVVIGYSLVSLGIVVYFDYKLLRMAGLLIMYPGSFGYYRGMIESSYSTTWKKRMEGVIKAMRRELATDNKEGREIEDIGSCLESLKFFRNTIMQYQKKMSARKEELVDVLGDIIQTQIQKREIKESQSIDHQVQQINKRILVKLGRLEDILKKYRKPEGMMNQAQHYITEEKLYRLSYGFGLYDMNYFYERRRVGNNDVAIFNGFKHHSRIQNTQVVLFCHPNGAYLEQFAVDCKYTNFYLQHGLNVCLWNYRGYSESKGQPCIRNNQQDVLRVYDALKEWGYNPIITHGYSIGGPVAIHLAKHRKINLLVADRTFSSLYEMSKDYGTLLSIFNYLIFWREQTNFSEIFYELKCNKALINDSYDQVVSNSASLKTGLSKILVKKLKEVPVGGKKQMGEFESESLQHVSGHQLNSPLVRHLVTQEKRQYSLLNHQFTKAFISNTMPFAIDKNRDYYSTSPASESLEKIVGEFQKEIPTIKEFEYREIREIQEASPDAKTSFSDIEFPNSCYYCLPTINLKELESGGSEDSLIQGVESYVNGLIAYGCCWSDERDTLSPSANRAKTIIALYQLAKDLEECENENEEEEEVCTLLNSLRKQIAYIGCFMYDHLSHPAYAGVGILIPTLAGHNGDLRGLEFVMLSELVKLNSISSPDT